MAFQISLQYSPDYLQVTVVGQANFDDICSVWREIARACKAFGCSNVLRDGALPGKASILDIYRIGNRIHEFGLPPGLRVAFVCDEKNLPRLNFNEAVIADRVTGVTIRNFVNRVDAERWLIEEPCRCQASPGPGDKESGEKEEKITESRISSEQSTSRWYFPDDK